MTARTRPSRPQRTGTPTKRTTRPRLQPYIALDLYERFTQTCAARGISETAGVHAALKQYLDPANDRLLVLRRLDQLGRSQERTQRDLELFMETFAIFVQFWFAHTPVVPADQRDAARRAATNRYKQFVDHVGEQFGKGHRFLDDLPKQTFTDEQELEALAREPMPPAGQ